MLGFDLFSLAQEDEICVWPENELAFTTFCELRTQWRAGFGGATGMDYTAALALIDRKAVRRGLTDQEADELFEDVRHMEYAALEQMAEGRDKDK